jgi:type I restriction enzyme, S subunit
VSRIDDLLAELCPGGVEHKSLGELGDFIRGNGLQKKDLTDEGIGAIHYGQIHTYYGTSAAETKSFVAEALAAKLRKARAGDLVIATTSEDDGAVGKAVAWLGQEEVAVSSDAYIYRHSLEPTYLSFFFQSDQFQTQKRKFISGTKVRRLSADALAKIKIAVPPRVIQEEIARTLTRMQGLKRELDGALGAELEARRQQHEHYRQAILDRVDADAVALSTLGKWQGGFTPSKSNPAFWESGTIPWLASMDVSDTSTDEIRGRVTQVALDETSLQLIPAPSVAVVMRSNILRRVLPVGLVKVETTVNQDMRVLVPREGVDAEYVYQALRAGSERIRATCVRTDGSMAAVDSERLFSWEIPLPSLDEQRTVAETLRHFDALVNDLSMSLPAELNARRKQYEYYRDQLLTFPEAA